MTGDKLKVVLREESAALTCLGDEIRFPEGQLTGFFDAGSHVEVTQDGVKQFVLYYEMIK